MDLGLNSNRKYGGQTTVTTKVMFFSIKSWPLCHLAQLMPAACVCVCCFGLGLLNSLYILPFTSSFSNIWSRWLHCSMIMTCLKNDYLKIAVTVSLLQLFYVARTFEKGCAFVVNNINPDLISTIMKTCRKRHFKCNQLKCEVKLS